MAVEDRVRVHKIPLQRKEKEAMRQTSTPSVASGTIGPITTAPPPQPMHNLDHGMFGDLSVPQGSIASLPSQHPPPLHSPTISAQRRRRSPKPTMTPLVKRSLSTPNVRADAVADVVGLPSSSDKRRNKLGYHRTSVACGHCRRRKIRCLLAPDDPEGRCSNCIRLKKECNFFPVEQQGTQERRSRPSGSGADASAVDHSDSNPSSPALLPYSAEQSAVFGQYHGLPMHPDLDNAGPLDDSGVGMTLQADHISPPIGAVSDFDRAIWQPVAQPEQSHHVLDPSHAEEPTAPYWRPVESPISPSFSPYPAYAGVPGRVSVSDQSAYRITPRQDQTWEPSGRSMSFGQIDSLPSGYGHPYINNDARRTVSHDFFPQPTDASTTMPIMPVTGSGMTPVSSYGQFGHPQQWQNPFPAVGGDPMNNKRVENFGGWYPDASRLGRVQEEEPQHYGTSLTPLDRERDPRRG